MTTIAFIHYGDSTGNTAFLTAGLGISLREKSAGDGFSSASGVVTPLESLFTAERKGKETRGEPVDLKNIAMIGQLTRDEGVASNAAVPNDRLSSREGKCMPQHRHRMSTGADTYTRSDSGGTYSVGQSINLNREEPGCINQSV